MLLLCLCQCPLEYTELSMRVRGEGREKDTTSVSNAAHTWAHNPNSLHGGWLIPILHSYISQQFHYIFNIWKTKDREIEGERDNKDKSGFIKYFVLETLLYILPYRIEWCRIQNRLCPTRNESHIILFIKYIYILSRTDTWSLLEGPHYSLFFLK